MRRRPGIGGIQKQRLEQEKYKDKGTILQLNYLEQMSQQVEIFRRNLEEFALKHKTEIKKNPQFRRQFQEMCASIGVDPLASGKGFWSVLAKKLNIFGNGFCIIEISKGEYLVQSIPGELNMDHTAVLQLVSKQNKPYMSVSILREQLQWDTERAKKSLNHMIKEGLAWMDLKNTTENLYWFPSMFNECINSQDN